MYVVAPTADSTAAVHATTTSWLVTRGDRRGDLTVSPGRSTVTGGQRFGLDVSWNGLDEGSRWLAVVTYRGSNSRTFVTVN